MDNKHNIAVTGIVIKDNKYLITRRNLDKKLFPEMWTIPGGNLEFADYINNYKDTSSHLYNILEKSLRKKFRYIDPEILINGKISKLFDIFDEYKNILNKEKENSLIEKRVFYSEV